ncbi:glycosyltransferase WbuB [Pseudaminobacter arsenicus]|uniref:Glycosyltransferase WbuB n=1 Tax=Borborobacter arsenicus TaxID=1851146 RepID=A0A432V9P3_9HYPH|nr:glycosyltransferase family 4 protein [Pseudaminobacter arsenicus]RUM98891.1 glycosyltransferase WbuB [Pseudaminobacter arsenicus]
MNIWYIHHYGGGPNLGSYDRPYQLGKAWQELGHSPTVFIAAFHHLLQRQPPLEAELSIDGVRYLTVPARPYSKNGIDRLLNIWDFSRNLYSAGRTFGERIAPPDLVIASSPHPFTIFPAHKLARCHGAKLAFEIRDIWPLSITEILGTSRLHPFVQMCAFAERFALKNADLIASVLPRADRYLAERGYGSKPFVWVPNGIGMSRAKAESFSSEAGQLASEKLKEWRAQGKISIIYTGSIGKPNAIDLLLKAIAYGESTGEGERCAALIVGKGEQVEALQAFVSKKRLSNVHFSGSVPKNDAVSLLNGADIGYAGLKNIESLFGYGISPNKIADYFQASLPVILPIAPCGDPVSESGGGIARKAETPEAVWEALRELILLTPEERSALGAKGKAYVAREYDYNEIARRYVEAARQL